LGIAGAIIYYYNTTDVFAEEPRRTCGSKRTVHRGGELTVLPELVQALPETEVESEHLPTIESIAEERKRRQAVQAQLEAQKQKEAASQQQNVQPSEGGEGGMGGLEAEADQQGAFNPETGEINWDCPCLGGMADGPCGPQFKAAFSCFVYSTDEPKGMDCIDKFKYAQNTIPHVTSETRARD
jgi:intermembrane space import and assembly protein 40